MPKTLRQKLAEFEERFDRVAPSVEERRLRAYLTVCLAAICIALVGFVLADAASGHWIDAARSSIVVLVLASLAIALRTSARVRDIARLAAATSLVIVSYEAAIGANQGATFLWFYTLPLAIFFVLGRREGAVWTVLTAASITWILFLVDRQVTVDGAVGILALATFGLLAVLGHGLETARRRISIALEEEKEALERHLNDIEALRGLVPICASCKRTRDDRGYWSRIETYLARHSTVELTSALCPDCVEHESRQVAIVPLPDSSTDTLPDEESAHARHRRFYFTVGLLVLIPCLVYFGSLDLSAGRELEATLVFGLAMLLTMIFVVLGTERYDQWLYHLAACCSLVVLAYELHVGAYGGYAFLWLYSFPAFTIFLLGARGTAWSAAALVIATLYQLGPVGFSYPPEMASRFLTTYTLVTIIAYGLEASRRRGHGQLLDEQQELRRAIDQVETLRGLLPLCPSCKSVRDDRGFWEQIDTYMTRVSGTRFTHGLCPECAESMLAELDEHPSPATLPPDGRGRAGTSGHLGDQGKV